MRKLEHAKIRKNWNSRHEKMRTQENKNTIKCGNKKMKQPENLNSYKNVSKDNKETKKKIIRKKHMT